VKLKIELVPSTVWFSSLYKLLLRNIWDQIREEIIRGYNCQIRGNLKPPMELHEIWKYDDKSHVQKLIGFQLLCRLCHHVKH